MAVSRGRKPVASPHTRGWTVSDLIFARVGRGFPAHAGMDRPLRTLSGRCPGLPRTRGDGPIAVPTSRSRSRASPHTRGWTPGTGRPGDDAGGLPRTRGDGPCGAGRGAVPDAASPHTRGWTAHRTSNPPGTSGFPAHAGMDRGQREGRAGVVRLPRTRGDGPRPQFQGPSIAVASPHTRGWTSVGLERADDA